MRLELGESYEVIEERVKPETRPGSCARAVCRTPILLDLRNASIPVMNMCQTFTSFSRTQPIPVVIVSGRREARKPGNTVSSWARPRTSKSRWHFEALKVFLGGLCQGVPSNTPRDAEVRVAIACVPA